MSSMYTFLDSSVIWTGNETPNGYCLEENCNNKLDNVCGPFCCQHTEEISQLVVGPSLVDPNILGLFASKPNSVENQPIFKKNDLVGSFGGRLYIYQSKRQCDAHHERIAVNKETLYSVGWETRDFETNEKLHCILDSQHPHSGVTRYANSSITYNNVKFGHSFENSALLLLQFDVPVLYGTHRISEYPGIVATKNIYQGEEIITNYGSDYWTLDEIQMLDKPIQEFLAGNRTIEPPFFYQDRRNTQLKIKSLI